MLISGTRRMTLAGDKGYDVATLLVNSVRVRWRHTTHYPGYVISQRRYPFYSSMIEPINQWRATLVMHIIRERTVFRGRPTTIDRQSLAGDIRGIVGA
jgi:hypothetical protein